MLYETAARAGDILALNVEDLDLPRKRAVIIGKGGHKEYVFWASGAARLLSRMSCPPGETNAHTRVGEDCPANAPQRYSRKQVAGGRSTNNNWWHEHQPKQSANTGGTSGVGLEGGGGVGEGGLCVVALGA